MKKSLSLEEILVECWEGTRQNHAFLSSLSEDGFAGYVTAMTYAQDARVNKLGVGVPEIYAAVKKLLGERKL